MKFIFYFILLPALLPVFLILHYIYKMDREEPEPIGFVLRILIYGAVFSLPVAGIERFVINILANMYDVQSIKYAFMENTVGVALIEELSKYLVLMIFVWKNENFDHRYDGIVYATAASLGFAALENILYIINFGASISLARAIFAIPGHTTFGVFMGYYFSRAKHASNQGHGILCFICQILALIVPMFIHGLYDFLLSDQFRALGYDIAFYLYVLFLDFRAWRVIKHEFRTDREL